MSYILNALRKSEQERQAKQAQPIENSILKPAETVNQRSRWPVIVAVLVIVNVITLVYFFGFKSTEPANSTERQIATNKSQLQPAKPVPTKPEKRLAIQAKPTPKVASKNTESEPKTPVKTVKPQAKSVQAKIDNPVVVAKQPASPLPKPVAPTIEQLAQTTKTQKPIIPKPNITKSTKTEQPTKLKTSQPQPKQAKAKPPAIKQAVVIKNRTKPKPLAQVANKKTKASPTTKPIAAVKAPPTKTAPAPTQVKPKKAEKEYPLLKTFPYEFKRNVPKLNINVFVYNEDPKQCFVIVDMLKYQTGQLLPGNLKLKEIRQDSLVVDYKKRIFRIKRP